MKKSLILVILIVNVIIFLILLIFTEFILYKKSCDKETYLNQGGWVCPKYSFKMVPFIDTYTNYKLNKMRKPEGLFYAKKPILLFGCSFAYGDGLEDHDTLSYKLSKLTKRPVYNRANGGWGIQHMLYQLRRQDFYKEVQEPEYAIYVLIGGQIHRLKKRVFFQPSNDLYLRYKEQDGDLIEVDYKFSKFWFLSSLKYFFENVEERMFTEKDFNKNFDLIKLYFLKSKEEINKHYPFVKLVIFNYRQIYQETDNCYNDYIDTNRWDELRKEGFIVIDSYELVGEKICSYDYVIDRVKDTHPNAQAWDLIVPKLAEKLNL